MAGCVHRCIRVWGVSLHTRTQLPPTVCTPVTWCIWLYPPPSLAPSLTRPSSPAPWPPEPARLPGTTCSPSAPPSQPCREPRRQAQTQVSRLRSDFISVEEAHSWAAERGLAWPSFPQRPGSPSPRPHPQAPCPPRWTTDTCPGGDQLAGTQNWWRDREGQGPRTWSQAQPGGPSPSRARPRQGSQAQDKLRSLGRGDLRAQPRGGWAPG